MEKIAILPGGFKPPHAGHYNMAKWLANNTDADTIVVKIGSGVRDGITREISLKLWNLYRTSDPDDTSISILPSESPSPVRDVYDFIEQEAPEGSTVYLGMGEKDIDDQRFKNIGKFADPKNIKFETVLVPPQAGGVSGTEMRSFIKNNDKKSFQKYLPDHLTSDQEEEAWDIVTSINEDLYDPNDHYRDFAKTNDPNPKKPISPSYKYHRAGVYGRMYEQQGGKTLRVYDFDDTLAITRGANIKVKHEDGTIDTLDPAEFAVYQEQPGDKFDFTEFDSVIKEATPIQHIVDMLKKDVNDASVDKVTILTARLLAYPVKRYLREELGLDVYVVAVGSSDPLDKATWIEDHILKGYNDIMFIDDSEPNRKAVNKLKDIHSDIKLDVFHPHELNEEMYGMMTKREKARHKRKLKKIKKDLKRLDKKNRYYEVPKSWRGSLTRKYKRKRRKKRRKRRKMNENATASIKGQFIPLEVMDTPELQVQGMMGRDKLEGGMVFPYDGIDKRTFHTQNCKIPLDIIFIADNEVTKIFHDCPPCQEKQCPKYSGRADNVLELPGGYCEENNINVGDQIGLNTYNLPKPLSEQKEYRPFKDKLIQRYVKACNCKVLDKFGNCPRDFFPYWLNCTIDGGTPKVGDTFIYPINNHKVKVHKVQMGFDAPVAVTDVESTNCGVGPISEADPKKGTGKKPKGSGRRLYTDENPKDTVKVKFSTRQDIVDTLNKKSFKSKPHKRQSQIINLIHQRVRAALSRTKDPQKKKSLKSAFEYIKKRKEASKKKTQRMKKENVFTKGWWKDTLNEILLKEGGAAGHMAHPFNLPDVNSGSDLKDIFNKSAESLQNNPGSVKIDGVNSSIRLIDLDGEKQFVMDRGSKKELDIKGITKDDLLDRFGDGHGMVKIGGEVLDMFNNALPSIKNDLEKLGVYDDPNILFNMEYVSGKTNVQDYGSNFIAIHGLNKIESKEVEGKRGPLIKRVSSEVSYDKSALQSLLDNLAPTAKEQGFEVYGSVPTEMSKKPNFSSALSQNYTIVSNEGEKTQTLDQWLNELNNIPEEDFIFMNVDNSKKKVGAVSKLVYTTLLKGDNIDELFESEEDKQKAIEGFTTYLATEKLGDEVLKVLNSPMGSVDNHEGVVIRDKNIANVPFKITGKFILGGMASDF